MIKNTKCSCGHNNPVDTILCEYCGIVLNEEILNDDISELMRYDGVSRKSSSIKKSIFKRLWRFFSSVKVAIYIILATLLVSIIGTILPQEKFVSAKSLNDFYYENYGLFGSFFYKLGITNMYASWWFFSLLSMIGISLIICSLDRIIPLHKALTNQNVFKDISFISRQKVMHKGLFNFDKQIFTDKMTLLFIKNKYSVQKESDNFLAEKGRISRYGPYINHIGLIVVLLGILLRYVPGWHQEEMFWVGEGEIRAIPNTDFFIQNNKFEAEFYSNNIPKKFSTNSVLYKKDSNNNLVQVKSGDILVNNPLEYGGASIFQQDYKLNQFLRSIKLDLNEKVPFKKLGTFEINFNDVKEGKEYPINQKFSIYISEYYPDFDIENGRPITKSKDPNKPAFIMQVKDREHNLTEKSWVIAGRNSDDITPENKYKISLNKINMGNVSGLMYKVDKSLPLIFFGGIINIIGLVMGFYWYHRRIWVHLDKDSFILGAHTNKNWFGLDKEVESIIKEIQKG